MKSRDLIFELCREAGVTGPEDELIEEWEANHACCCNFYVDNAAQGDMAKLTDLRKCMGLPTTR